MNLCSKIFGLPRGNLSSDYVVLAFVLGVNYDNLSIVFFSW